MESKDYKNILEFVFKEQINYIINDEEYEDSEYLQGMEVGLRIALDKLKISEFLVEHKQLN